MKKIYEKSELTFALVWIGIYCVLQSLANPLNKWIGIEYSASAIFCILQTGILFFYVKKNGLLRKYGLCKASAPARRFLYYVPLIILASSNLWNGAAMKLPLVALVCHSILMLCVGFLEELIFRGLLFQAMAKDNVKSAIVVSSITFGLGHLLNLGNGSGMGVVANLFQIVGAVVFGFLFVMIFYRSGSLIPCIFAHAAINILSAFANETGLTVQKRIVFSVIELVIIGIYTFIITKTSPQKESAGKTP